MAVIATLAETTAAQRMAADPGVSVWASANAGAGKTKVLIDRIARLLLAGAAPQKILAVTYTKAAAAEMQTRLFETLGKWTVASDDKLQADLLELEPDQRPDAVRLAKARRLFAAALEAPGGLQIQTIHGFCTAILQRFPLEAGLTPGFRVLDDRETAQLQVWALERAVLAAPDAFGVLQERLDGEALGKQLAVASAALKDAGVSEVDFQRALGRASAAFGAAPDFDADGQWLALWHGCAKDVVLGAVAALSRRELSKSEEHHYEALRQACEDLHANPGLGWEPLYQIALTKDGEVRKSLFNKPTASLPAMRAFLGGHKDDGWPGGVMGEVFKLEDEAKKQRLSLWSASLAVAAMARKQAFGALKAETGALDFDDLLARTAKLLTGEGAARWVLYKLDQGIEHVLIDEAQDTSPEQWQLFAPLLEALDEGETDTPRTRFVVGDEKQSIYSFQGARPERFKQERADFLGGGDGLPVDRRTLEFGLSFRTGQAILDAVDAVWFVCGPEQDGLADLQADADEQKFLFPQKHFSNRADRPGVVEVWDVEPAFSFADASDDDEEDNSIPLDAERDSSPRNGLAERIAQELKARIGRDGVCSTGGEPRLLEPGDVMILLPRRGPLFHQIIKRLKAANIPVAGVDRINLPGELAVQDLIALGRFALTPQDDFNLACVLKGPFCGLVDDQVDLFPLAWGRGRMSLWQRLGDMRHHRADWGRAFDLLSDVLAIGGDRGPFGFYATVLEQVWPCDGGALRTGWQMLIERLGREVREPVEIFLNRALDHGVNAPPGLVNFLQSVSTDASTIKRELGKGTGGVRVMTVHGAKGLEAPLVILPDTTASAQDRSGKMAWDASHKVLLAAPDSKSVLPPLNSLKDGASEADLSEHARLLYVAMTRARDHLIVCAHAAGAQTKDKLDAVLPDGRAIKVSQYKPKDKSWWGWISAGINLLEQSSRHVLTSQALASIDGHPDLNARLFGVPVVPYSTGQPRAEPLARNIPSWVNRPATAEHWSGPAQVRRLSPSRLIDDGDDPPVNSPVPATTSRRFLRGRLIHELLQHLPELAKADWPARARARLLREPELDQEARDEIASQVLQVLAEPGFAAVFGPGSRAEVRIAGHGPGLPVGVIINGTIDRLVVTDREVLVLDFKTNRPPPRTVDQVARTYLIQMAAYRALLQATWPGRTVRAALLWTDVPSLMELPDALMDLVLSSLAQKPGRS